MGTWVIETQCPGTPPNPALEAIAIHWKKPMTGAGKVDAMGGKCSPSTSGQKCYLCVRSGHSKIGAERGLVLPHRTEKT
jgi:hypothetical protein